MIDEGKPDLFRGPDELIDAEPNQFASPELKERFGGLEVLQYLLIDRNFAGAVCGHWRIGPHDVEEMASSTGPTGTRQAAEFLSLSSISRWAAITSSSQSSLSGLPRAASAS